MSQYQQGNIVWIEVDDPAGRNRKRRPVVIVTPDDFIDGSSDITGVAISTQISDPLPPHHIRVPSQKSGHPTTKLKEKCVAVCDWLPSFRLEEIPIQKLVGKMPAKEMVQILGHAFRLSQQ